MAGSALRIAPVTSAAPSPSSQQHLDVHDLSLTQLHKLAGQGSRRARAELERRMGAVPTPNPAIAQAPTAPPMPLPVAARLTPDAPALAARPPTPAQADQWLLMERQALERSRAAGPPRLVGLVLMAWGVLLGLGGLVLLAHRGGGYYLLCALGCGTVGWLLMQRQRWALAAHGVLVLLALAWAWRTGGALAALVQAAPVWIAALWMAVPAVREGLD